MNSINATRAKWFVIGAAAALAAMRGWGWWNASGGPHQHVYGRWRKADPVMAGGNSWQVNHRFCNRCGWRDWKPVLSGLTEQD